MHDPTLAHPGEVVPRQPLSARVTPTHLLTAGAVILLVYLALVPLIFLLYGSFTDVRAPGTFTVANYLRAYTDRTAWRLLVNSAAYAAGGATISFLAGTTLAWMSERTNTPLRGLFFALSLIPLIIPGVLFTVSWIFLLSPRIGLINVFLMWLLGLEQPPFTSYSLLGMMWVDGLHYSPLAFLLMSAAFRSMDPALEESALMSGAGLRQTFSRITLRLAAPAMASAFLILFVRSLETFEVPALLGLPVGIEVFTSKIWLAIKRYPPDFGLAGAYAATLLLLTSIGVYFYSRLTRETQRFATVTGKGFRPRVIDLGGWRYLTAAILLLYLCLIVILPLFVLVWNSLLPFYMPPSIQALSSLTLENYPVAFKFPQTVRAIRNSIVLALSSAALVMLLTSVVAWIVVKSRIRGRWILDNLATLPVVFPGLVMGVALMWVYLTLPVPIYGTLWILLIAYITRFLPYGMRACSASLVQIHRELEEAAQVSGASAGAQFRRIVLPLLKPGLLAGGVYIIIVSIRELGSSVLLWGPGAEVFSVILFDLWQTGLAQEVSALGVLLTVFLFALATTFHWLSHRYGVRP